tara:strand:+ start:101 stop:832 length:732 start_codon:yes stop_codon:yes gene_type:complete
MIKKRLGVNIDHVATIRNARGEKFPDPLRAALEVQKSGGDSVTIHLREDRRHIKDYDLKKIKKKLKIPLNLEMAPTIEMLKIAIKNKPDFVCIVPEKRKEITTEGGLNIKKNKIILKKIINNLKKNKIRTSLFVDPTLKNVELAYILNADSIEIHTGEFCSYINNKNTKKLNLSYYKIRQCANYALKFGIGVHAGHGLNYKSTLKLAKINSITEFNIGHFIIGESIFSGLKKTIKNFKKIINT